MSEWCRFRTQIRGTTKDLMHFNKLKEAPNNWKMDKENRIKLMTPIKKFITLK